MKHIISTLLLGALALPALAQMPFTVKGQIKDMPAGSSVVLSNTEGMDPKQLAEADIQADGTFTLTGEMDKGPRLATISVYAPSTRKNDDGTPRTFRAARVRLLLSGEPITVTADTATIFNGDMYHWEKEAAIGVSGGEATRQYAEYLDYTRQAEAVATKASYAESTAYFEYSGDQSKFQNEIAEKERTEKIWADTQDAFLREHPNYYCTAALIAQRVYKPFTYTQQQMQQYIDLVKDNPDTMHVNFLARNHNLIMSQCIGTRYTDFSGKQPDNCMKRLSELMPQGKYVLVDFWASWCGPCRSAIPKVKKMAEEYKDRLAVVSVSVDEKEDAWRKAEKAEAMPWPQLLLADKENYNAAVNAYTIQSIPRLVLIAPDGNIAVISHDPTIIPNYIK